ncbi:MAG: LysR family transcriptional regulator [Alphaproteobacteria bacterium]|nr:LysR family transcriptional regulator [Alphaproteobacteria bacterium]MBL6945553.1 LysR family transcriptional regulator [Rhodospirillales bacterium]
MELKPFSYFITACHKQNSIAAVADLGIAQSTLSSALAGMERTLQMPLFRRSYNGLHPTAESRWLYQQVEPILLAERLAMRLSRVRAELPLTAVLVESQLRFALGRVSRAASLACGAVEAIYPDVYVEPRFVMRSDTPEDERRNSPGGRLGIALAGRYDATIQLNYKKPPVSGAVGTALDIMLDDDEQVVRLDDWIAVVDGGVDDSISGTDNVAISAEELAGLPVRILDLPTELVSQASEYCKRIGVERVFTDREDPGALPRLSAERTEFCYLLPKSLLSERFQNLRIVVRPLVEPLTSALVAKVRGNHPVVQAYLDALRDFLSGEESSVRYRPELTLRQFRYFGALGKSKSMTAAARHLNIAQPALTKQVQKLEKSIGVPLVLRGKRGHRLTQHGMLLFSISRAIENSVQEMDMRRADLVINRGNRLAIGFLPAAGPDSMILECLSATVDQWLEAFPEKKLSILEGGNVQLHEWVNASKVNIAIVDYPISNAIRLPLAGEEPLCVFHSPRFNLLPDGPVRLIDAADIDLAVPTHLFGLRRLIEIELMALGRQFDPVMEVNSFQLGLKILTRRPFGNVLPRSAVGKAVANGQLVCHEIIEPHLFRRLSVIFSPERSLSEPERAFIRILRENLASKVISENS